MRIAGIILSILLGVVLLGRPAAGQEGSGRAEQIQRIRQLPADEKRRLKEALTRFNALAPAEREALRTKAREVGIERLGELAGRDFGKLRQKHVLLRREMEQVLTLLGGPERFASLTADERDYVREQVLRGFQRHCRQRLLESAELPAMGFEQLPGAEKRARLAKAWDVAIEKMLDEKPPEEKARFLAMTPIEQRSARAEIAREWRLRETVPFTKKFEGGRLLPLFDMAADGERRRALVANRVRWFQLASRLQTDGADRETLRMLGQLRCDERAQVAQVYEQSQEFAVAERRARVEAKIRELYGTSSFDAERMQRPPPRLPELLRERAFRERERRARESQTPPR